jgi:hypothetical protein
VRAISGLGSYNSLVSLVEAIGFEKHLIVLDDLDALLMHDRVSTVRVLRQLLKLEQSRILTTSREMLPAELLHEEASIERLDEAEAIEVFRKYAGNENINLRGQDDRDAFDAILKFLGGYAFPIRLAATYLRSQRCSLPVLLESLCEALERLCNMWAHRSRAKLVCLRH